MSTKPGEGQTLRQASHDQWEDLRSSIERALTALEESFDQVKEKVVQVGWLGWTQVLTEKRQCDSESWAEGMKTEHFIKVRLNRKRKNEKDPVPCC